MENMTTGLLKLDLNKLSSYVKIFFYAIVVSFVVNSIGNIIG